MIFNIMVGCNDVYVPPLYTMLDTSSESSFQPSGNTVSPFQQEVITSITELQGQKKLTDVEISKLEETAADTKDHLKSLEKAVSEIREMARDAKHISIGVDGRNGLRGTLDHLVKDVSKLSSDVEIVKKAADDYVGTKEFLKRVILASFMGIIGQVTFAVWYVSAQHAQQESMKADVTRLLARMDSQADANSPKALLK